MINSIWVCPLAWAMFGFNCMAVTHGVQNHPPQAKELAQWIKILQKNEDPLTQEEALEVLGKMGPGAREALPTLKKIADDSSSPLRKKAAITILRIDPQAEISTEILIEGLLTTSPQEKLQGVALVARAASVSPPLTKRILESFPKLDSETRRMLIDRMSVLSPDIFPILEGAFRHPQSTVRAGALALASKMTEQIAKSLPVIQKLLDDPDLGVRFEAARIVWSNTSHSGNLDLIRIFQQAAQDAEMEKQLFGFLKVAQPPLQDKTVLEIAMQKGPSDVRLKAIEGLAEAGKPTKDLFSPLLDLVQNDVKERANALRLMGRICPNEIKLAVPDFVSLFKKGQDRAVEIELLGLFTKCGSDALKPLMEIVHKDKTGNTTKMDIVYTALSRIGAPAVESIVELLDSEEKAHPMIALRILGGMGPTAKPAVPRIMRLLDDPALGNAAANALGGIGAGARSAVPDLIHRQQKPDPRIGNQLVDSLIQIFPAPEVLIPVLKKTAQNSANVKDRLKAVQALWKYQGESLSAQLVLRDLFNKEKGYLPSECWKLTKELGQEAKPLFPDLFRVLKKEPIRGTEAWGVLCNLTPKVKYQPSDQEVEFILSMLKGPRKMDAALMLIAFDREKDNAFAALKEEWVKKGRLIYPIEPLCTLGIRLRDVAPELLEMAKRLEFRDHQLNRLLWILAPESLKGMKSELEKKMKDTPSKKAIACLLLEIDPKHNEALQAYQMATTLPKGDSYLLQSLRNLEEEGVKANHLQPQVEKHLAHPDLTVRQAAAVCLWRMTGDTNKTVPVLVEALRQRPTWHAGNELARMGPSAESAVPALMTLAETESGFNAWMIRDFAFQINRAAAFDWWQKRDRK